MRTSEVALY
jgi:hypothetical protein